MMLCTGEFQAVGAIPRDDDYRRRPGRIRHPAPRATADETARGRPPAPIGVATLWAMYLVVFSGSAVQWLLS